MDGICANCGLAYAPSDRECAQCGQEVGRGREAGWLRRLFGGGDDPPDTWPTREPDVAGTWTSQRIEIIDADGGRRIYTSMDDVPAADRARLEQAHDLSAGLLDGLEDAGGGDVAFRTVTTSTDSTVTIAGDGETRVYDSFDDLPPEVRARIQQAFDQVEALGIDMPDAFDENDGPG